VEAAEAGYRALRWVADGAMPADGGLAWPDTRDPDRPVADDVYRGTAGVLVAFAEARLSGIDEFNDVARAGAGRIAAVAAQQRAELLARVLQGGDDPLCGHELGLYTGLAGQAAALQVWADVTGDEHAADSARAILAAIAAAARAARPLSSFRDLLIGEAGVLLTLVELGPADHEPLQVLTDRLLAQAVWTDGEPDWLAHSDIGYFMPNFSHGAAGIASALAAAGAALDRPDAIDVAQAAARRLVRLGSKPDGTIAVPHSIPLQDPRAAVSYGWCHGPTGTHRVFQALDRLLPGQGWARHADSCRRAVRESGLPARLYPGFWDNLGHCCGTAGVGEMALDSYQDTGDPAWLAWAGDLAEDVLSRSIADARGVRWSHTEHRRDPPELPPSVGWMQGAAGVAAWLLRLGRVRQNPAARRLRWPDRPSLTGPADRAVTHR
jgi:lantibiotic modifying enzyme